jgi:uncharacterized membrane protein
MAQWASGTVANGDVPPPPAPLKRRLVARAMVSHRQSRNTARHRIPWESLVPAVPLPVLIHLSAAICALALGTVMLVRRKGTLSHKFWGRIWAGLMLTVAVSSLWIPSFLHLTWIHLFTLLTFVSLPLAIYKIRRGNVKGHAASMKGLFIGGLVIAGMFTLVPGRILGNLLWHTVLAHGS